MSIAVLCPGCNARLGVGDEAAGKTVKCPKCQTPMVIPAPESIVAAKPPTKAPAPQKPVLKADVELDEDEELPRAKTRSAEDEELPRAKTRSAEDEDEDLPRARKPSVDEDEEEEEDRPRKNKGKGKKAKAGPPVGLLIGGGLALLVLLGGGGFAAYWFGFREKEKDKPSETASGGGKTAIPAGWKEVMPPGGGFKVWVPHGPSDGGRWVPPPAKVNTPRTHEFECPTPDDKHFYGVTLILFPDTMSAADKDQFLIADLRKGLKFPPKFIKETTRKVTLAGRDATELALDVDIAGWIATQGPNVPKTGPKGQPMPDRIVTVFRYFVSGNRGYIVTVGGMGSGPPEADVKTFFDNFELTK